MQESMSKLRESLSMSPPEVRACIQDAIGADNLEKILAGRNRPTEELGEKMEQCFEKMMKGQDLNHPEKEFEGQRPEGFPSEEEMQKMYEERSRQMQGEGTDQYFRQFPEGERPPGEYPGEYQGEDDRGESQTPPASTDTPASPSLDGSQGGRKYSTPQNIEPTAPTSRMPKDAVAAGAIFFLNLLKVSENLRNSP